MFRRKKQIGKQSIIGHELVINPRPDSTMTEARHIARIQRCELALKKLEEAGKSSTRVYKGLQIELDRRKAELQQLYFEREGK